MNWWFLSTEVIFMQFRASKWSRITECNNGIYFFYYFAAWTRPRKFLIIAA
jgi:hypothetical protein